jgi:hypothetical protein
MSEQRPNEIIVRLIIKGFDCSPSEITNLLEIAPTYASDILEQF